MSKNRFPAKRLAVDGVLVALFFVLSLLSFEIAGIKVTFDALAVVLAAMMFGPTDAFLVGLLGAFLEQLIHFGLTPTTVLWILPPALRGVIVGLVLLVVAKKCKETYAVWFFVTCILAGLFVTVGNTAVFYVDAKMFGYYSYELIFGVLTLRFFVGIGISAVTAIAALPVAKALRRAGIGRG